ncbi:MAG: cytochrome c maturation protein CcmE [Cyclobacteriaceae bacterium]
MKKSYILGIVVIAVAITVIISTAGDASSYVNFEEAKALAASGNDNKIHVVGALKKDDDGSVVGIETGADKQSFSFLMVDQNDKEQKVVFLNTMPQDFLRSEQVVVVGAYHNDAFLADKILMKCPSKYQEQTIEASAGS